MKQCSLCKEQKDRSEFYLLYGRPIARCKRCTSMKAAQWYKANMTPEVRARWSVSAKARQARIKDATFIAYGGWKCACCGELERKFLTLDHINGGGNRHRIEIGGRKDSAGLPTYLNLYKRGFPPGFQVLCMNCNFGKRMNNGECPHLSKRNDYPLVGVGSSDPKRIALPAYAGSCEEIVCSASKVAAAN